MMNRVAIHGKIRAMVWSRVDNGTHCLTAYVKCEDHEEVPVMMRDDLAAVVSQTAVVGDDVSIKGHLHVDGTGFVRVIGDTCKVVTSHV